MVSIPSSTLYQPQCIVSVYSCLQPPTMDVYEKILCFHDSAHPWMIEVRNDIDVYLQPLIVELKQLCVQSVPTFDALMNKSFSMHVVLM